jgi:hypothetical protein
MKRLMDKYKPHIKEIYSYTYEEDLKRDIPMIVDRKEHNPFKVVSSIEELTGIKE